MTLSPRSQHIIKVSTASCYVPQWEDLIPCPEPSEFFLSQHVTSWLVHFRFLYHPPLLCASNCGKFGACRYRIKYSDMFTSHIHSYKVLIFHSDIFNSHIYYYKVVLQSDIFNSHIYIIIKCWCYSQIYSIVIYIRIKYWCYIQIYSTLYTFVKSIDLKNA